MLFFTLLFSLSFAIDDAANSCDGYHYAAKTACGKNESSCTALAAQCVTSCSVVKDSWSLTFRKYIRGQKAECESFAGGASPDIRANCTTAYKGLISCQKDCRANYDSCLTECQKIPNAVEVDEYVKRCDANYKGKPVTQEPIVPEVEPETPPSDSGTGTLAEAVEDPPVDPMDPKNTGTPNDIMNPNSPANALNAMDIGTSNIGSNDSSAIDFTSGPVGDADAFRNAASGVTSTAGQQGYVGQGSGTDDRPFEGEVVGAANTNGNNAAAGGGAGGGAGGVPPLGGGGGAGGAGGSSAASAKKPGAPGNYRSSAADYLSKHSPFSFQAPGGTMAPGAKRNTERNVANKKAPAIKYNKKENDGKDVLTHLFGNGVAPASYRRNPYGAGSGQKCLDTVFCSMEIFYDRIERFPNHEINPDSF